MNLQYKHHFSVPGTSNRDKTVLWEKTKLLQYKREHDISGNCLEPKSGSIFQEIVSDNGVFACLAANLVCKMYQNLTLHYKQQHKISKLIPSVHKLST